MTEFEIDYTDAVFNGGFLLVDGLYETASIRFGTDVNREVVVTGPDRETSYHDAKELFEQVALAVEMADPDGFREVLATLPRYGTDRQVSS